jgi:CBS domain-containing protein
MANHLTKPISDFIDTAFVILEGTHPVSDGVKKMQEAGVDSVIISDGGQFKGIVTYRDVLFDVVAKGKDPLKTTLKEIMHSPLFTIQKDSTVSDAISMMKEHNVRRLVVVDKQPIGTISQKTLAGNIAKHAIPLPELEIPNKIKCPYCSSLFNNTLELSSHIDKIHIGMGLFEGNLSRAEDLGSINPPYDFPKTL